MTLKTSAAAVALVVISLVPAPAFAWGTEAHRFIMRQAIELLPPELKPFFVNYRDELVVKVLDIAGNPIGGARVRGVAIGGRRLDVTLGKMDDSAEEIGTVPTRMSMIRPMPFWPSLEPCAKDTPPQVRIRMPRIHHGGATPGFGSW